MNFSGLRKIALVAVSVAMVAVACATPDIGPDATASLDREPTPTPTPEELAFDESNVPTPEPLNTVREPTVEPTPSPEPGLTDELLRIGVIADITTGDFDDPRGRSAHDAIAAWASSVRSDGLAGREVVVKFINSGVGSHDEAIRTACESDLFALVGSWSRNDDDGLDVLLSPDCGLPDFVAEARTPNRRDSPGTYVSNPFPNDVVLSGPYAYFAETFPDAVQMTAIPVLNIPAAIIDAERLRETVTSQGWSVVSRPTVEVDADLAMAAQELVDSGARTIVWGADGARLIGLLAQIANTAPTPELVDGEPVPTPTPTATPTPPVDSNGNPVVVVAEARWIVDCQQACYSQQWLADFAASQAENPLDVDVYVTLATVPFEEVTTQIELTNYIFWLGRSFPEAEPEAVGISAWAAGLLFEEAVNRATNAGTSQFDPDLLTRANVRDAVDTIDRWTASGLHGEASPAARQPSECFVVMRLVSGEWRRKYPFGPGNFECDDNLFTLVETAELGTEAQSPSLGGTN